MSNLADSLDMQHDYKAAEAVRRDLLAVYQNTFGQGHADTLVVARRLAESIYADGAGDAAEAARLQR